MQQILPNIYLSGMDVFPLPSTTSLTAVLSLLTGPISSYTNLNPLAFTSITHLHIDLSDTPEACLLSTLPTTLPFIHTHTQRGHELLIHCHAGISRSVSTLLAYILWTDTYPITSTHSQSRVMQALNRLQNQYPCANPSETFLLQLQAFDERAASTAPRAYNFPPASGDTLGRMEVEYLKRASIYMRNPEKDVIIRCRKCRTPLIAKNSLIFVERTRGFVSVLPVQWMKVLGGEQKLRCPKERCNTKVGRVFQKWDERNTCNWSEFEITLSAVDLDV